MLFTGNFRTLLFTAQRYKKNPICAIPEKKNAFFSKKIWSYKKKVVPLHPEL
jgi:hypothetical protein